MVGPKTPDGRQVMRNEKRSKTMTVLACNGFFLIEREGDRDWQSFIS